MRTEEQVLKDFEKLGYKIIKNTKNWLEIYDDFLGNKFLISRDDRAYCVENGEPISMLEHNLLTEIFNINGWL